MTETVVAVVPAAGEGKRFGEEIPKSLFRFEGRTIIGRTLENLLSIDEISSIIVLCPPNRHQDFSRDLAAFGDKVQITQGGETRQLSVCLGLEFAREGRLVGDKDIVVVHDGARCFATPELIGRVIEAAKEQRVVSAAIRVSDSLVSENESGTIEGYLTREKHWLIQTPQAFQFSLLYEAHIRAQKSGNITATDDASLLMGSYPVHLVEGERTNVKVTVKEDLAHKKG